VPLRDIGLAGERKLTKAATLPPGAQEASDWKGMDYHASTLAHAGERSNYL